MKMLCKDCGDEFELSSAEVQFFCDHEMNLPNHCKACKTKRNHENETLRKRAANTLSKKRVLISACITILFSLGVIGIALNHALPYFTESKEYESNYAATVAMIADQETPAADSVESVLVYLDSEFNEIVYTFRTEELLSEQFESHGADFGYQNASEYLRGANRVIQSKSVLHKKEAEDQDDVYYLEETNEFVVVSTDGYVRTYFKPDRGIEYYEEQ